MKKILFLLMLIFSFVAHEVYGGELGDLAVALHLLELEVGIPSESKFLEPSPEEKKFEKEYKVKPKREVGEEEKEKFKGSDAIVGRFKKESNNLDNDLKVLQEEAGRGFKKFFFLFKNFKKPFRNRKTQILSVKQEHEKQVKELLEHNIFEKENLKNLDKDYLEKLLKYFLEVDPSVIQRVVNIRRDAGIATKSYDLIVNVYERTIDLVEYLLYMAWDRAKKSGKEVKLDSKEVADIKLAIKLPASLISIVDEARFLAKEKGHLAARKFAEEIDYLIARLIKLLKDNETVIKKAKIPFKDFEEIVKKPDPNRVWCTAGWRGNPKPEIFIELKGKKPEENKKYYKHLYIDLYELIDDINKFYQEEKKLEAYQKIIREQRIIAKINRFLDFFNLENMCKWCFISDMEKIFEIVNIERFLSEQDKSNPYVRKAYKGIKKLQLLNMQDVIGRGADRGKLKPGVEERVDKEVKKYLEVF